MIGPVSNLVAPTTTGLKNTWRAGILIIYFAIPTFVEFKYNDKSKYAPFFNWTAYRKFLLLILFQVLWQLGLVYGGVMIIQIHAYVFNTSVGQWIVLISYMKCVQPIKLELIALCFTIAGQVLMMFDPNA